MNRIAENGIEPRTTVSVLIPSPEPTNLFDWDLGVHEESVVGVILDVVHEVDPLIQGQLCRVVLGKGVAGVRSQCTGQLRMLLQQVGCPTDVPEKNKEWLAWAVV